MYRTATLIGLILGAVIFAECVGGVCYRSSPSANMQYSYSQPSYQYSQPTYSYQPSYSNQPLYSYYQGYVPSYSYTPVYYDYSYMPVTTYYVIYDGPVYSSCSSGG